MRHDLVIIGGGIHGAGIAQAGAAAGHRVLLLEQNALAHGSSSRSSKLVHGGLRYLESGQIRLVYESLRERAILLRVAPALVRLVPFHIPIYADTRRRVWQIGIGLSAYAALAGWSRASRFSRLPRAQWTALDGLDTTGMQAVFRYHDAQTDDAALTRAVMASAQALGAELAMPAQFVGAQVDAEGCTVQYRQRERQHECRARVVINASGAWATDVLARFTPQPPTPAIERVRGSHIVLPGRLHQGVYYLEAPADQRAVFAMPYGDDTLVGTTEATHTDSADAVHASAEECAYLRAVAEHYFARWRGVEPLASFAGLRVLPAADGRVFHRSRETRLLTDDPHRPRVLSVLGGKLTTYRATAEKAMRMLAPQLPQRTARADTRVLML
jgi:glycerol-3-phosphate dehydrogenase